MSRHEYTATAVRDGRWWLVTITELDTVGQARTIQEVQAVATEVTALYLDVPEQDVAVTVTVHVSAEAEAAWAEAESAERESRAAQLRSAQARRRAVAIARADHYTIDAAAAAFGVSRTRVRQLLAD